MNSIVSVPSNLLDAHRCQAIVITCMDFRFWEATFVGFAKKHLGIETFDVLIAPGCTKFLIDNREPFKDYLLHGIALSVELHHPQQLILVHHSTCGAYGIPDAQKESTKQCADLLAARTILREHFSGLQTHLFFANAKSENEITYEEVE